MRYLSGLIFLPVIGAAALYVTRSRVAWRAIALITTGLALTGSIAIAFGSGPGFRLEERFSWIPSLGSSYHLGVDGLSAPLIVLTTFLTFLSIVYASHEEQYPREFFALFLAMEAGLIGAFCSLDLLLFYLFFEVALVPMYFIIGIWGHGRRIEAAMKYFLYTRVGSVAMLLSILALYVHTTPRTFDLQAIIAAHPVAGAGTAASLILLGFFIGFAIKLPVVPFHSWLPDAHTEAPTAGSVMLAGLLLKLGGYGFLRIALPVVPQAFDRWATPIVVLAVISAIYGTAVAMAQTDLKRLIAFSSINHMGYVMLGVAIAGVASANMSDRLAAASGAAYQLVAHGIVTAALFFLVGMLAERTKTREIARMSGVWKTLPLFGSIFATMTFASMGLPALAHFAAEVQIVLGTIGIMPWAAAGMLAAIVLTTAMFLWTLQRVLMGRPVEEAAAWRPLDRRELGVLVALLVVTILLGVAPAPLVRGFQAAMGKALMTGRMGPR